MTFLLRDKKIYKRIRLLIILFLPEASLATLIEAAAIALRNS